MKNIEYLATKIILPSKAEKNVKTLDDGFLAMNRHKSQQEWTSSTSAKSGEAVLAAELRKKKKRELTSQIIDYNIGRQRKRSASQILKSHSVLK